MTMTARHMYARESRNPLLTLPTGRGQRVVAVSPHPDDAVFSIGAVLAEAAAAGLDIVNVTVFAGDPTSTELPGSWDRHSRFASAGAAARVRRREDERACRAIGIQPHWLAFRDEQYGDKRTGVWEAIAPLLIDAAMILIPGFPLRHPDHMWVHRAVQENRATLPPIGFYVEQPYAEALWFKDGILPERSSYDSVGMKDINWQRVRPTARSWLGKQRAFRAYHSQLRAMTRPGVRVLLRIALYELWRRGECLAVPLPASGPVAPVAAGAVASGLPGRRGG